MATNNLVFGLVVGAVMAVLSTFFGSGRALAELPPRFLVSAIVCQPANAIILGGQRGEHLPGDSRLFAQEAVAFAVPKSDGSFRRVSLGPGFVADASHPEGQIIFAVRREWFPDKPERGYLVRSSDFGETWDPIEAAPRDIIGVAFDSAQSGYVWSGDAIYRTEDQGSSWSKVEAPGLILKGSPKPVVDRTGALWVATGHGPAWDREHNLLVRVFPDLRIEVQLRSANFRVWAMDVAEVGGVWLLTEDGEGEGVKVKRLSPSKGTSGPSLVADLPAGLPKYFRALGSEIVVVLSASTGEEADRFLMVSSDSGTSWKRVRPPEPSVESFCAVSAERIWMVGSSGRVYPPK